MDGEVEEDGVCKDEGESYSGDLGDVYESYGYWMQQMDSLVSWVIECWVGRREGVLGGGGGQT